MQKFKSIQEVEAELAKHMPIVKQIIGKDITLHRTKPLMKKLGNPENKLKIIHIAGTSGKTSTAYFLSAMLSASLDKVGLTVSPHIDSLTERVQINGKPISEKEFCQAFGEFMDKIAGVKPEPSYFEIMIAFAYWYFQREKVDYAVVETGLGGLHDATNVAQAPDKVCVITDIGIDHTKVLGKSLSSITAQKAGIIHKGNQVYVFEQLPEINREIQKQSDHVKAELHILEQRELGPLYANEAYTDLPGYQRRNWLLARQVYQSLAEQNKWDIDASKLSDSLQIQVPGRMDVINVGDKLVVMDGAHNLQKMSAFVETFKVQFPAAQADVLLAMKEGKEYQEVLPLLLPVCNKLILTTFDVLQDLPAKSIKPAILAKAAKKHEFKEIVVVDDPGEAVSELLKGKSDTAIITGSFYLLSAVRPQIIKT